MQDPSAPKMGKFFVGDDRPETSLRDDRLGAFSKTLLVDAALFGRGVSSSSAAGGPGVFRFCGVSGSIVSDVCLDEWEILDDGAGEMGYL